MTVALKRLSTDYSPVEDRVRFVGEIDDAESVVLWLTQRLLRMMTPVLLKWVENPAGEKAVAKKPAEAARTAVVQSFVQEAARASALVPSPPVQASPQSTSWMVHTVDFKGDVERMRLRFIGAKELMETQDCAIVFEVAAMRQFLAILQEISRRAGWPQDQWPDWMEPPPPPPRETAALH